MNTCICWYCGVETGDPTKDHIVSKKHGGDDSPKNMRESCRSCNSSKMHRSVDEFRYFRTLQKFGISKFTEAQKLFLLNEFSVDIDRFVKDNFVVFYGEQNG